MSKTKSPSLFTRILSFFCWIAVLLLWGCAATVFVNPAEWGRYIGVVGLGFPFCVAFVLVMFGISVVCWKRTAWICIVGLLGCIGTIRDYSPVNLTSPVPKGCLKVMTYNTMAFGSSKKDGHDYVIPRYLITARPDIVCMQEATCGNDEMKDDITRMFRRGGYEYQTAFNGHTPLAIASRFPIVDNRLICHTASNAVAVFTVRTSARDSIRVVCAHLQSMGLTPEDRGNFHQMLQKPEEVEEVKGKRTIVKKIANATRERALMADTLAAWLDAHAGERIILMGDFNDTPVSYTHHVVCDRLTDAYRATANGIGRSFNRDGIYVRIDNIFCSSHWKPYGCEVLQTVPFSDHFPMVCYLKEK